MLNLGVFWVTVRRVDDIPPCYKGVLVTSLSKDIWNWISGMDEINSVTLMINLVFVFVLFCFQSYLNRKPTEPKQAPPPTVQSWVHCHCYINRTLLQDNNNMDHSSILGWQISCSFITFWTSNSVGMFIFKHLCICNNNNNKLKMIRIFHIWDMGLKNPRENFLSCLFTLYYHDNLLDVYSLV